MHVTTIHFASSTTHAKCNKLVCTYIICTVDVVYLFIYLFASGNMAHKKHEHDRQGQKMNDENTNIKEHTKDTHTHRKQLK